MEGLLGTIEYLGSAITPNIREVTHTRILAKIDWKFNSLHELRRREETSIWQLAQWTISQASCRMVIKSKRVNCHWWLEQGWRQKWNQLVTKYYWYDCANWGKAIFSTTRKFKLWGEKKREKTNEERKRI